MEFISVRSYNYAGESTADLIAALEWGFNAPLFNPTFRCLYIECAAAELACRQDDQEAIAALCGALSHIGAFYIDGIEGLYKEYEVNLRKKIAGKFLRDHKCMPSTVALLHAATAGQSETLRYEATKSINRRPIKVQAQALHEFMKAVRAKIAKEVSATICDNVFPNG